MRKLLMLATMALAAMAFAGASASSASADYEFWLSTSYETPYDLCPEVTSVGNEVSGGCVTEGFEGTVELYQGSTTIGQYAVTFDLVLDSQGQGYAVDPTVNATGPWVQRSACDESDGTVRPWAVESRSPTAGQLELETDITLGMRPSAAGPGGACVQQEITVDAFSWYGTSLDQASPSANVRNGEWESNDTIWINS